MQSFEVILFFKLRTKIQQKTVKPTYLLSVRCQEAGGRKRARELSIVLRHEIDSEILCEIKSIEKKSAD